VNGNRVRADRLGERHGAFNRVARAGLAGTGDKPALGETGISARQIGVVGKDLVQ
jgi:hypothetical protein